MGTAALIYYYSISLDGQRVGYLMQNINQAEFANSLQAAARSADAAVGEALKEAAESVTQESKSPADAVASEKPHPWIIHPVADFLFCCGGFPLFLYALFLAGARIDVVTPVGISLWFLYIIGLHFFQDSHGVASWYRILTNKETFSAIKYYFVTISIVGAIALVPLMTNHTFLEWGVRLSFILGFYHWLAQSYGVSLIYCFKRGYFLNNNEKRILHAVFQSLTLYTWARLGTSIESGQFELGQAKVLFVPFLPDWTYAATQFAFEACLLLFVGMVVLKYVRTRALYPLPALVLLASTVVFYTLTPIMFSLLAYFLAAYYHASQSWCVTTSFYWKNRGLPAGVTYSTIWKVFHKRATWGYFALLMVFTELIFRVLPRIIALGGINLTVCFAAVAVVFSIHHFLSDAAIWKLRNPKFRKMLVQ